MTPPPKVAVVVVCRPHQVGTLAAVLAAVDGQQPAPAERVVVMNGCEEPADLPAPWTAQRGSWAHPAGALNHGLAVTRAPWVMPVPADHVLAAGAMARTVEAIDRGPDTTAVVYRDAAQLHAPSGLRVNPDHWALRIGDHIGRGATWRRTAVELVGGWSDRCQRLLDDALALDLTAAGWTAVRLPDGPAVAPPEDTWDSSTPDYLLAHDRWQARSLAIVSLHAGREATFPRWERFLMSAELPRTTALYVVDNSGRREFTEMVHGACRRLAEARRLSHVDIAVNTTVHHPEPDEWYLARDRNLHVARLYTSILPRVQEDLVLTLEDDIEPPPFAIRRLGETITDVQGGPTGAVSAAWDRVAGEYVSAGLGTNGRWGPSLSWKDLPHRPIDVGCVGGACTLWANSVLSQAPVSFRWSAETGRVGWDVTLSEVARRHGFRVRVHGDVRCVHHTWGVLRVG